jgi:hypothetical protein
MILIDKASFVLGFSSENVSDTIDFVLCTLTAPQEYFPLEEKVPLLRGGAKYQTRFAMNVTT